MLFSICAAAQDNSLLIGFGMEANEMEGKIIRHSAKFTAPIPPVSTATELNFVWKTYGRKYWEQECSYPQVGVGIIYTGYGLNSVFGRCVGIDANLQLPIITAKKLEWTCRFGIGLAYVTKKYQNYAPYDTLNTAVSTHYNAFPVLITDVRYHINDHWDIQAGANFTHISNALYEEPNLGVNMAGVHIGTRYFAISSRPQHRLCIPPRLQSRYLVEARAAISYKHARAAGSPVLPVYVGALAICRRWHRRNKYYIGADYAYHHDVYAFLKNYGVDRGVEKQHSWDGSYYAGNEFVVGKVGILTQAGLYYHQTYLHFDDIVEKLGVKYYITGMEHGILKETFLSALLTTHGAVAEYAEIGIGIAF